MINLDSILKSRDITLPTKVRLVKAIVFPVVMYGCAAAAKLLQSCPTLCDPTDSSPPGSPAPGILQGRTLEWVAISSSKGSFQPRDQTQGSALQVGYLSSEPPGKPIIKIRY